MESTISDNGQSARAEAKGPSLTADMQDLLGRIAHVADPEIARLRARIERGLTTAKRSIGNGTDRIQRHTKDAVAAGDDYVRGQPWQAVGIAAAVGLLVGFLVARR